MRDRWLRTVLGMVAVAAVLAATVLTAAAPVSAALQAPPSVVSLQPARIMETRVGYYTIDLQHDELGRRPDASTYELPVAGRAGVPANAAAVMLNVTAIQPDIGSFVTLYPCGTTRPLASNLNPSAGAVVATAVLAKLGTGGASAGKVCIYTDVAIHLVIDINGYVPATGSPTSLIPARLLETRVGPTLNTVDGLFKGGGRLAAGSTLALTVTGRGGVPAGSTAVFLNVTAILPDAAGYLTVFPCGTTLPNASNLNPRPGEVVANAVLTKIGVGGANAGKVCIYASSAIDLVVDVNGSVPAAGTPTSLNPARLLETRTGPGLTTVDGQFQGGGRLAAGSTLALTVTNRGGVPASATAVIINLTGITPDVPLHLTVYPCGATQPVASNLNLDAGQVAANLTLAKIGTGGTNTGKICIYTSAAIDLVIDVNGYIP